MNAAYRLQHMNLNRMSINNRAMAITFLNAIFYAMRGNRPAMNAAMANLPRLHRIRGYNNNRQINNTPARRQAATTIQRIWRGGKARNRVSNIRRYHGARTVVGPNGNIMVAIPTRKTNEKRS
jgi:hypothetical protein